MTYSRIRGELSLDGVHFTIPMVDEIILSDMISKLSHIEKMALTDLIFSVMENYEDSKSYEQGYSSGFEDGVDSCD